MKSIYKHETEIAKNGSAIPIFENGNLVHSKYNPQAEAAKMADRDVRYAVVIGVGGGYHIESMHRAHPEMTIIAVENSQDDFDILRDIPCVRSLLKEANIIFCTKNNIAKTLLSTYIPVFHGDLQITTLRAWTTNYPELDAEIRAIINIALKNISADFSVQTHFGRHWHRNILENLKYFSAQKAVSLPVPNGRTAAVIAAGPTLDVAIKKIEKYRKNYVVIATDTAFSALVKRGIFCDVVVSIDCQNVSFRHFLHFPKKNPPLCVFDIGSPHSSIAIAAKNGAPILFSMSAHPLAVLAGQFGHFLSLESGAGTVTIAAADFARQLGFCDIELFGADFSYSRGKPYAAGTYFDEIFGGAESRISRSENAFCALMYRTKLIAEGAGVFSTEMLKKYAQTTRDFFYQHGFSEIEKNKFHTSKKSVIAKAHSVPFPFQDFRTYLLSETEKLLAEKNIEKFKAVFFAHLPLIAAIKEKNLPFFDRLKLAYEASVRYTV